MKRYMTWVVLSTAVVAVQAQVPDQIRRASISGSRGNSGKCTIEVRVDMSAEVDIYGDAGRLRTVAGQPATWTRMDCTDPLPYTMADFRFQGIDGRGDVRLVQDPRNNNGMAVIRIDDPKAGAEGYTFDIEWSGGSGGAPTGGFSGTYSPAQQNSPAAAIGGGFERGRGGDRGWSAEQAIVLCRTELRTRAERDYNLRNIDITAAGVDANQGRRDWITGAFTDRGTNNRRGSGYRFNCAVDYNSGEVRTIEIRRIDGSTVLAWDASGTNHGGYDQNRAIRACQDAVVARTNRDGYRNVSFNSTDIDTRRNDWIAGTMTASRGRVTDTFDFSCSMELGAARVRNIEVNRR